MGYHHHTTAHCSEALILRISHMHHLQLAPLGAWPGYQKFNETKIGFSFLKSRERWNFCGFLIALYPNYLRELMISIPHNLSNLDGLINGLALLQCNDRLQRISGTLAVVPLWGTVWQYLACIAHLNNSLNLFASKLVRGVSAASSVYTTNLKMISYSIDNTQA